MLLNIAGEPRRWDLGGNGHGLLLATDPVRRRGSLGGTVQLQGNEGLIIAMR